MIPLFQQSAAGYYLEYSVSTTCLSPKNRLERSLEMKSKDLWISGIIFSLTNSLSNDLEQVI